MHNTSNLSLNLSRTLMWPLLVALLVAGGCSGDGLGPASTGSEVSEKAGNSPVIDVWYGDTQRFGHVGNPQVWANILGNVSDPDGIASLTYSLNSGPQVPLTVGTDPFRLELAGDFNIDLLRADLVDGTNQVVITATDSGNPSSQTVKVVTVEYNSSGHALLPYLVNWDQMSSFDDAVTIVDGEWERDGATVRTTVPGWDRLIAFGDMAWVDYEVTVPILFHTLSPIMATGLVLRWNGHTDEPVDFAGAQPKAGYLPVGSLLWFKYDELTVTGNRSEPIATQSRSLSTGVWYMFKARAETLPAGLGAEYSLKVWEQGQPEPSAWDLVGQEFTGYSESGGAMLVSHEADVSYGNVTVTPLPLNITNIGVWVSTDKTVATIDWRTNQWATSSVAYGLTSGYEIGTESDASLTTNHSIVLSGLSPDTDYHYQITSEDSQGNPVATGDLSFTTDGSTNVDCSVVPAQYVGVSDGCDCPADGSFFCDPDCINDGNAGGSWCGCQYCYGTPGGTGGTGGSGTGGSGGSGTGGSGGSGTGGSGGGPPSGDCSVVPAQYVGVSDGCDCPADGSFGCDPDCINDGNVGGSWCGCQYCYGTPGGTGGIGGTGGTGGGTGGTGGGTAGTGGAPPPPADCSVVPPQYVGVSDGCDCPPDGSLSCDPDCIDDGNVGGSWCGCQYCYGDPPPLPGECAVVPLGYVGVSDGCDCPASGSFDCDPDCIDDGNVGGGWCGCQYCYGTQP